MPDNAKKQLKAARTNVLLVRYMLVLFFAALFLLMILFGAYYLLDQTRTSAQQLIDANESKAEVFSATQSQVNNLSESLSVVTSIVNQEIRYSNVLVNLAQQMPAGTVFKSINFDSTSFSGTPVTLTVYARTTDAAVALQDRFQTSPYFSAVNFQEISDGDTTIDGYPVTATMSLIYNRSLAQ